MKYILLFISLLGLVQHSSAQYIRRINTRNGLSNSAVIYMFQDKEHYLWMGTFDGLNKYDGVDVQVFKPNINDRHGLSGNIIRRIIESKDDYLWITTKGGLNKFSRKNNNVEAFFPEFQEDCTIACDSQGNFYILTQTGVLYHYDFEQRKFEQITIPNLDHRGGWIGLRIDASDNFWIITNGAANEYILVRTADKLQLQWAKALIHPCPISHFYADKGTLIFMDHRYDIFTVSQGEKKFIRNIAPAVKEYGNISSIIFDGEDIVIGFWVYGAVKLNKIKGYAMEKIPLNCGVLSLLKDDVQDILWIGTDGYGAYAYAEEEYTFKGVNFDELPIKTRRPVHSIITDDLGDLWLGTKGNGIIRISGYENATEYNRGNVTNLTTKDGLRDNSIFAFEMSKKNNILWIGSASTISYYSYDDRKIHALEHKGRMSLSEVQSIVEMPDNTLWVSSRFTLHKIDIHKEGSVIKAGEIKSYEFNVKNKQIFNHIYAIYPENDSIMWLAIRGNGAIRFNCHTGDYLPVAFDKGVTPTMNDILNIHKDKSNNLWFGSNYGINKLRWLPDNTFTTMNYNERDGLPNNAIRGIVESYEGKLWLSSNMGLILFDTEKQTFRNFNQESGLKVVEFSDNAYYKDKVSSRIFFGGVDGVVWIESEEKKRADYKLPMFFTNLYIQNQQVNINDYNVVKEGRTILQLKHNQNFFNITFSVADFRDGAGNKFFYMLEGFNEVWMNANFRQAQFTNIPPGRYLLKVRYGNNLEEQGQTASMEIEILPPWYLSVYAKSFYLIVIAALSLLGFFYVNRRLTRKRMEISRRLSEKYREEMNENKLRFYTNITHELCTPLTLIHTPSERILNYEGSDAFIKKYAQIIKSNSERLHGLIQEIIDFRRIETGNKVCRIDSCYINDICGEIMEAYADLADENSISFELLIDSAITWNTDRSCINTILNNLVSNAFKYTPISGTINIGVGVENQELTISVYNSGNGIRREDIPLVFRWYSVLDNVSQSSIKGISARNGLGLAICKNMAELLGGTITIESQVGEYARFIVKLPLREVPKTELNQPEFEQIPTIDPKAVVDIYVQDKEDFSAPLPTNNANKPKILVVDDNEEILWVLTEILSDDYIVVTAKDGNQGMEQYVNDMPDLVITDIMMPNQDGISMIKRIKVNPHTTHIPIVIMSAKSAIANKIEGIESGADAYITKPFDTQYLKTIVRQLIEKHKKLKEYYNSSASAFEYLEGRLISKEDNEFIHSVVRIIDENIGNGDFNPEDLADNMGLSLRSLYRKFKEIDVIPPKDFIKKQRIEYAAKLLLSTNLTVQEIMYAVGFTTRSFFHKEFCKRYNLSPKEYREKQSAKT